MARDSQSTPNAPQPDRPTREDVALATAALTKRRAGENLTREESRALRRVEGLNEERARWEYYQSVPKRHYVAMCGRAHQVINEQARRYGLPLRGKTVNLFTVLSAFHDLVARNARRLARTDGDDPMSGESSPALERWREEKYQLARLDRLEREGSLVGRDDIHEGLTRMAAILRRLGETMQRQYGRDAHQLVEEAIDDWEREIHSMSRDHDRANPTGE